jgi:small-conductance mechanosensitive channel
MESILNLLADWQENLPLYLLTFLLTIVMEELIFSIVIGVRRKRRKATDLDSFDSAREILKILRIFFRFFIAYFFIKALGLAQKPSFPVNLFFDTPAAAFLIAGLIIPLYKIAKLVLSRAVSTGQKSEFKKDVLSLSHRGIKITLFLLSFSLLIWITFTSFPNVQKDSLPIRVILIACGILIAATILLVVKRTFNSVIEILEDHKSTLRTGIIVKSLSLPVQILIVTFTLFWLKNMYPPSSTVYMLFDKTISFLILVAALAFLFKMIEIFGSRISSLSEEDTNTLDKSLVEMIRMILRITLAMAGMFGVARIITGKPLTTLLAGLGIGGLALALAAQDTLKNFFGSIMIMTDKPFKIGERILIKNYDGVIESIGFRSTRIRTLVGHQVIIPNDQMASNSVENIGRRPHIRRLTNITLTYGTTPEKMEKALSIIKELLDNHEGMSEDFPPRVYFNEFNSDSLNIMMIYWYSPPNYWDFMSFSERINLQIMKRFDEEGIEFAFPTSTTYLEQEDGKTINLEINEKKKP